MVSNVTGENLDRLKKFLHLIPPACSTGEQTRLMQEITEFHVSPFKDTTFEAIDVKAGVGLE